MKKLKYLLLILMAALVLPFSVLADEGEENNEAAGEAASNEVVIYFFRGEGCSHCAEAEEWFASIEEELGEKFVIKDFETWYNEDNSKLMEKVAKIRKEEETATGVPYIIIGEKSWIGFDQSYTSEIIDQVNALYEIDPTERYDIMTFVNNMKDDDKEEKEKSSNDVLALVIILLVAGASAAGIVYARKQNA